MRVLFKGPARWARSIVLFQRRASMTDKLRALEARFIERLSKQDAEIRAAKLTADDAYGRAVKAEQRCRELEARVEELERAKAGALTHWGPNDAARPFPDRAG